MPGDVIATLSESSLVENENNNNTSADQAAIRLGPGLIQNSKQQIVACKAGMLRSLPNNKYFVDCNQKRVRVQQ